MTRVTFAGEIAGASIATRGPTPGLTDPAAESATGVGAGGAIGDTTGARSDSCRWLVEMRGVGARAGLTRDPWADRTAGMGAGVSIARRGPAAGATGSGDPGTGATTGGDGTAGGGTAGGGASSALAPSLTVSADGVPAAGLDGPGRAGRRRAGLGVGPLSTCGRDSRGHGMKPKWPAAANTAPPAKSRPTAARAVDQRNLATPR